MKVRKGGKEYEESYDALFMAPDQASKHQLLEEVISYTDQAGDLVNADPMAMFGRVYAKARLGEELPIAVVLKRGYTSQIPKELDALLAKPGQVLVLDVRRPDELISRGSFPVFLNIQTSDVEKYADYIPKDRTIITVSNRAHRAGDVGDKLTAKGFKIAGAAGSLDYDSLERSFDLGKVQRTEKGDTEIGRADV